MEKYLLITLNSIFYKFIYSGMEESDKMTFFGQKGQFVPEKRQKQLGSKHSQGNRDRPQFFVSV